MKKVYFAGSIRGGRNDSVLYAEIIAILQDLGCEVLTEHLGDKMLSVSGETGLSKNIYDRDLNWLKQADVLVAEVTTPSLGVGYEIAKAEKMGKPILCLFRPEGEKKLSAMIQGNPSATVVEYRKLQTAEHAIATFIDNLGHPNST